jgi:hypothetical protein
MNAHIANIELEQSLRKVARQIKNKAQTEKRKAKRKHAQGCQSLLYFTVLAVYVLSKQCVELAAHCWCLSRKHRGCKGEDTSLQRGKAIVCDWVASANELAYLKVRNPDCPHSRKAVAIAQSFLKDSATAAWALQNNWSKGHAPSTLQLWLASIGSNDVQVSHGTDRGYVTKKNTGGLGKALEEALVFQIWQDSCPRATRR